jgi:acetoin:2,6-dichlorophenolindophenol oxidoreductase subunit alpha
MSQIKTDIWSLYKQMYRSRVFEETIAKLWQDGLISGEMHLGLGEEAICAAVNANLEDGDALALDHRGTPPLLMRGTNPKLILLELLGSENGLCRGMGGHMHLFAPSLLAASSGIVGAAGPSAAGFALAAKYLRPGKIAIAYFGEGAMNEGMLLESFNLAVAWQLPVLFVCKDNNWSITTRSSEVTGGNLTERASSFGLKAYDTDGYDVVSVNDTLEQVVPDLRTSSKPAFIRANCIHLEGHFLGDPLLRFKKTPVSQLRGQGIPMAKSAIKLKGAGLSERINSIKNIVKVISASTKDHFLSKKDPLLITREKISAQKKKLDGLEKEVRSEIKTILDEVMKELN